IVCIEFSKPKAVINKITQTITPKELAKAFFLFRKIFRKISLFPLDYFFQKPGNFSTKIFFIFLGGFGFNACAARSFNILFPLKKQARMPNTTETIIGGNIV